jgi:hypothetical protein
LKKKTMRAITQPVTATASIASGRFRLMGSILQQTAIPWGSIALVQLKTS